MNTRKKYTSYFLSFLYCFLLAPFTYTQVPDSLTSRFKYDKQASFNLDKKFSFIITNPDVSLYDLKDSAKKQAPAFHVRLTQIHYRSIDTLKVAAWLVEPVSFDSTKKRPAIIFQHWGEGDKDEFLSEAMEYSKNGFICLLTDAVFNNPNTPYRSFSAHGYYMYQLGAINIQRGLDLLQNLYPIDDKNIFFVGHSYGAGIGGILTGIEPRFKSFILMTGVYSATESLRASTRPEIIDYKKRFPEGFNQWLQRMRPLDVALYIKHKKAPVFHQFATKDEFITMKEFKEYELNTPQPKKITYYPTVHTLNLQARKDRWIFINSQLNK